MKYLIVAVFILVFGGAIGFAIYSFFHRRDETFTGLVIDKDIIENQVNNNMMRPNQPGINIGMGGMMNNGFGGGIQHTYRIKVKTDAGKEIHYQISEGKYEIIKIGDRVSKAHGTTDVEIVSSSTPTTEQNPTQPMNPTPPTSAPMPPTVVS